MQTALVKLYLAWPRVRRDGNDEGVVPADTVEETARDLGISTGTVKSQTSSALKRLESVLAPDFQGER